ncbi:MAG: phenylacetate--CoA ligase family protein [Gemmatimonadaceae bacterium]
MSSRFPTPSAILRTVSPFGRRTRSDIENFRDHQIRELVAHAYRSVPFYTRLYDSHGVKPHKVRGFGDLPMLPLITKSDLQRATVADLVATGLDPASLKVSRTNGTTGEPLLVRRTRAESRLLKLYYFQAFRSLGVRRGDLAVGTRLPRAGHPVVPYGPFRQLANRVRLYPRAEIVNDHPLELLAELMRLKPEILGGVPGRLSTYAAHWPQTMIDHIKRADWPRMIVTGGERLSAPVRAHLGDTFNAPVRDTYSSAEYNLIAAECPRTGAYHVSDETVALEIVDGSRHVRTGESGQPVGTALHSFASPLIRFALGDIVKRGESACACGVNHSTISDIEGRLIENFELPGGAIFSDQNFEMAVGHAAPWVRQTRISQTSIDHMVLRIAPLRSPSADEIERLKTSVDTFYKHHVTFDVVIDPDLGPDSGEKSRSIIPLAESRASTTAN